DDRPREAAADEADDGDAGDAEHRRGEALPHDVVAATQAPGREVEGRQGAVLGARQVRDPLAEPLTLAVPPGLDAVVERVVQTQAVVGLAGEQVTQAPRRRQRGDQVQAPTEVAVSHGRSWSPAGVGSKGSAPALSARRARVVTGRVRAPGMSRS